VIRAGLGYARCPSSSSQHRRNHSSLQVHALDALWCVCVCVGACLLHQHQHTTHAGEFHPPLPRHPSLVPLTLPKCERTNMNTRIGSESESERMSGPERFSVRQLKNQKFLKQSENCKQGKKVRIQFFSVFLTIQNFGRVRQTM